MLEILRNKLSFAVLLVTILLMPFVPAAVSYAADSGFAARNLEPMADDHNPLLIAEDMVANAGETAVLDVRIEGNPGIIGATFIINYDSRLTLESVNNGEAFKNLDMTKPGELKPGCKIHWDTTDAPAEEAKDGTVLTLTFAIPDEAIENDEYAVSIAADDSDGNMDVFDRDLTTVFLEPATCKITVGTGSVGHNHVYGSWNETKAATCTEAGSREKACLVCGEKVFESLAALGHSWDSGEVVKEATDAEAGVVEYTCMRCGATRNEAVPPSGSRVPELAINDANAAAGDVVSIPVVINGNPGILGITVELVFDSRLVLNGVTNGEAFRALEMTKPGELKSGCRIHWDTTEIAESDIKDGVICNLTFTVPEDAVSGDSFFVRVAPAEENGQIDIYDRDVQPVDLKLATGFITISKGAEEHVHSYGAWIVTKAATCTAAGKRERFCSDCGSKITEAIAALGHSWDSGRVTRAATYDAPGVRTYTCQRCGATRNASIAKKVRTTTAIPMHRLYNPWSGEHFYTGDTKEKNHLVGLGWKYEGVGWNAPMSGSDVHRLYNPYTGEHHFTTNASEKNACVAAGWRYEGVGWKSGGSVKVYREYNPFAPAFYHNYTRDAKEHAYLCSIGWIDEGTGWNGV